MRKLLLAMVIVGSLLIVNAGNARADEAKSGLYVGWTWSLIFRNKTSRVIFLTSIPGADLTLNSAIAFRFRSRWRLNGGERVTRSAMWMRGLGF